MSSYEYRPIPAGVADGLRARDDAGQTRGPYVDDEGGAPLRCCLTRSAIGERIVLVSYAPLRRWAEEHGADPHAYDEVGPVFLHADGCDGPRHDGFPAEFVSSRRVFRGYDKRGHIVGGRLVSPASGHAEEVASAALDDLFADPAVEVVHVRAVEFGCFFSEVRRPV
ncbi:DUF1203 domain-containing protein [Jiangella mangrovi]|uniref:DUF1203 domain-containing protein n=1 Tax=Jiangella mangrovi TaxID=1524084 RepID=A0A7W9LMF7_9ACTN|nr:DUF1203 domain-containing protein [Jiangella mangrovi]MBB5789238.1 hypothetical protein [Jiangella mangrovi]